MNVIYPEQKLKAGDRWRPPAAERLWPNGLLVPLPLVCFCAEVGGAELIAWSAHFPTIHLYFLDSPNELDDEGIYQCPRALQQFFGITQSRVYLLQNLLKIVQFYQEFSPKQTTC